jgi:SAM-dependent methyltransferase
MTTQRTRARVFGEVADEYERIRPGYPEALLDDVLAYARLDGADLDDAPVLEVGAGTGKATVAFARRGLTVNAVEPDPAMAAVLARRVAGYPNVTVSIASFEEYTVVRPARLLFSAQAWHWTDPATRWQRAAASLAPGGALALFWNDEHLADPDAASAELAAHREITAPMTAVREPFTAESLSTAWPRTELVTAPGLGELSERLYASTRELSTVDYVAYLNTQSAYRILDPEVRDRLFGALRDRLGERVVLDVHTALYLARRLPD